MRKSFLFLLMLTAGAFVLASCSDDDKNDLSSKIAGDWRMADKAELVVKTTPEELAAPIKQMLLDASNDKLDHVTLNLNKKNQFIWKEGDKETRGSFKYDGEALTFNASNATPFSPYSVSNNIPYLVSLGSKQMTLKVDDKKGLQAFAESQMFWDALVEYGVEAKPDNFVVDAYQLEYLFYLEPVHVPAK